MNACIVPGSTISCCGAPRSGAITETVGTASSRVSFVTTSSALARVEIPQKASPSATASNNTPPTSGPNDLRFDIRFLYCGPSKGRLFAVQQREYGRDEEQGRDRRERAPADHGAAERRVLLAAFTEAERHGHHADDHRQRGHQHRPEARDPRLDGGHARVGARGELVLREADDEDA